MRTRNIVIMISLFTLAALTATLPASAAGTGVWPSTYQAATSDCGYFVRDANNYCWTRGGDRNLAGPGDELGVRFTSSQSIDITGVRVYRVSPGVVTGELWDGAGGSPLATGTFSGSETHSWQDLTFPAPVPIRAGHTYIASYHVTDAQYAFQYHYFAASGETGGPITAPGARPGSGNGVYCYDHDTTNCDHFPVNTYRDTNYWVTPLWRYRFSGFFSPVDDVPTVNVAKAGSAVAVRFRLGGNQGLHIFRAGYPRVTTASCSSGALQDVIERTVQARTSSLRYDSTNNQYIYVWKTTSNRAGTCVRFNLGLDDRSTHSFRVRFNKRS